MISCIIVDDEPLARQMIRMHLSKFSNWHIVQECVHAMEADEVLHRSEVQVMFLDIQMPHIKGTDFLRSLKKPPLIIFTTAHPGYALEGFELNAVDYLLKPVTFSRFQQAIVKAEQQLGLQQITPQPIQAVPLKEDFIFIRQDNRQVKVSYQDILFLEAKRDFTKIYLKNKTLLAGFHLKMLEDLLPASLFMRVHRSYMVSLHAITAVYGNTLEIEGQQVPIGAQYKEALNAALKI